MTDTENRSAPSGATPSKTVSLLEHALAVARATESAGEPVDCAVVVLVTWQGNLAEFSTAGMERVARAAGQHALDVRFPGHDEASP